MIATVVLLDAVPYAEELVRCLRADRSLRSRPVAPEAAPTTPVCFRITRVAGPLRRTPAKEAQHA